MSHSFLHCLSPALGPKEETCGSFDPSPALVASESSPIWFGRAWSSSYLEWTGWKEDVEWLVSDSVTVMWWAHEW